MSFSSARSAVSVGLSRECTLLLTTLERRVAGRDDSCRWNFSVPPPQLLSALKVDGWVGSAINGGVTWRVISLRRFTGLISYWASDSRSCCSFDVGTRCGEGGQGVEGVTGPFPGGKGDDDPGWGHPCCRMSAEVCLRPILGPGGEETESG